MGDPRNIADDLAAVLATAVAAHEQASAAEKPRRQREENQLAAERAAAAALAPSGKAWLVSLGVPLEEAEVALAAQRLPAVVSLAKISERRPILVLAGNTGCGKTVAAAVHLLTQRSRGQCAFITAVDLGRLWPRRQAADRARLAALETAAALVVDDLGWEEDRIERRLYHMVYQRAGNRRPTVLTANMTAPEFRARYGEAIWSRLCQSGHFEGIDEPDYRALARRGVQKE